MNRYETIQELSNKNPYVGTIGDKYYDTVYYPEVGASEEDIYVETEFGDRLDALAYQFYGDVTLWWIISIANPNLVDFSSLFLPIGSQIRIPQNISTIIDDYNRINR